MHSENTVRSITKLDQIEHFGLSKKAAMIHIKFLLDWKNSPQFSGTLND
jgi:hypothetical protein